MSFIEDVKWYLFPFRCICCNSVEKRNVIICDECRPKIRPHPHYVVIPNNTQNLFCCISPFHYSDPLIRQAILNLKFNYEVNAAKELADYLAKMDFPIGSNADIVTCVPLSKGRKRWRGFNQSELIATAYANFVGKEYANVLEKLKSNKIQSTLADHEQRKKNVKNMYRVTDAEKIKGKTIILIDDVYTSGATMNECARMLKKSGAARVLGMTVAYSNQ
ncbi:MAG: ComF family protein [Clostridia bacterium]|nr:ComF family protein [Clostridia bacterium]